MSLSDDFKHGIIRWMTVGFIVQTVVLIAVLAFLK